MNTGLLPSLIILLVSLYISFALVYKIREFYVPGDEEIAMGKLCNYMHY